MQPHTHPSQTNTGVPDIEAFTQMQYATSHTTSCTPSPRPPNPSELWGGSSSTRSNFNAAQVDAQVQRVLGKLLGPAPAAAGGGKSARESAQHGGALCGALWLSNEGPGSEAEHPQGGGNKEGAYGGATTGALEPLAWELDREGDVVVVLDRASLGDVEKS